jgi:hypothetical protein
MKTIPIEIVPNEDGATFGIRLPECGIFRNWSRLSSAEAERVAQEMMGDFTKLGQRSRIVRPATDPRKRRTSYSPRALSPGRMTSVAICGLSRYELQNAVEKVAGYLIRRPLEAFEPAFDRAKAECLSHLRRQIECVESLTALKFLNMRRRPNQATTTETP